MIIGDYFDVYYEFEIGMVDFVFLEYMGYCLE